MIWGQNEKENPNFGAKTLKKNTAKNHHFRSERIEGFGAQNEVKKAKFGSEFRPCHSGEVLQLCHTFEWGGFAQNLHFWGQKKELWFRPWVEPKPRNSPKTAFSPPKIGAFRPKAALFSPTIATPPQTVGFSPKLSGPTPKTWCFSPKIGVSARNQAGFPTPN